jgi:Nucleoside-diphosphate-sugar epimerases
VRILITGVDSFIGQNLRAELSNRGYNDVTGLNDCEDREKLKCCIDKSDFIFHLHTIYRSEDPELFESVNIGTTKTIIELIGNRCKSLLLLSSTQAGNGDPYGQSKLLAEKCVKEWTNTTGNKAYIFRLANEFGKWCPPNFNSVVATFCYNIARGLPIKINNPNAPLKLMYIDDIIGNFISVLEPDLETNDKILSYETSVGEVAKLIKSFSTARQELDIPDMPDGLIKKLYSTYLSYLPPGKLSVALQTHTDNRGSFTELFHFGGMGQVSVNISKPGVTKGNHWHHTKNEKFIVVSGSGIIKLRKVGTNEVFQYQVSGEKIEVVDIPPGYTHSITNTGEVDMLTIMWANEIFNADQPDTYFEEI